MTGNPTVPQHGGYKVGIGLIIFQVEETELMLHDYACACPEKD
jgi:hypothetical protein